MKQIQAMSSTGFKETREIRVPSLAGTCSWFCFEHYAGRARLTISPFDVPNKATRAVVFFDCRVLVKPNTAYCLGGVP